jgi:hypothetical protein
MIPRKAKTLYKEVADEVKIPESVVGDVMKFYYSIIRSNLTNIDHININLHKIGVFTIKKSKLQKQLDILKAGLEKCNTSTFVGYDKKMYLKNRIAKVERAIDMVNLEKERKKLKKSKDAI